MKTEFKKGDKVRCVLTGPLTGKTHAPSLDKGADYTVKEVHEDSKGHHHLNVGLALEIGFVTSFETGEELPPTCHWCHPSRFEASPVKKIECFEDLKGHTIASIDKTEATMTFHVLGQGSFRLEHFQDCCESVAIEDIEGDLEDIIGMPLTMAEESTNDKPDEDKGMVSSDECDLWTFYRLATVKGYVTIRFHGSSNGYYGVEVSFNKI